MRLVLDVLIYTRLRKGVQYSFGPTCIELSCIDGDLGVQKQ
jgi:hypothetical protein